MQFSLKEVIAGGFALLCVSVAATWYVRHDRIEELEQAKRTLEDAGKVEWAEGVRRMNEASGRLATHLKTFEDVQTLRRANQKLQADLAQLPALRNRVATLERELDSVFPNEESFKLRPGGAKTLAGNQVTVGFIAEWSDRVDTIINDNKETLYPGQSYLVELRSRQCRVRLQDYNRKVEPPEATFSVSCIQRAE